MSTKQLLSDARERLSVSRLGKSTMRETDKDLIVIRRLIEALDTPEREAERVDELNARQAAYRQHRVDFPLEHEHSPEIATSAFFDGWDAAVGARFRRSEVPEPSAEDAEFAPGECDGSGKCEAERHIHGCYTPHRADQCDAPEEYGHLPTKPQGEPTVIRCGGGCGAKLETSDPVNRRAVYLCPRCLETEVNRAAGGVR